MAISKSCYHKEDTVRCFDCEGELQGNPLSRPGRVSVALNNSRLGQSSITLLYDIFLYNSPPFLCQSLPLLCERILLLCIGILLLCVGILLLCMGILFAVLGFDTSLKFSHFHDEVKLLSNWLLQYGTLLMRNSHQL